LGCSWCYWKSLSKSNLIKFISQFLELRCGRYWFLNGFRRKHQLSFQCVHNVKFQNFQFRKCEKQRMCSHLGQQHRLHYLSTIHFENQSHGDLLWAMILILLIINILVHECLFVTWICIILVLFEALKHVSHIYCKL